MFLHLLLTCCPIFYVSIISFTFTTYKICRIWGSSSLFLYTFYELYFQTPYTTLKVSLLLFCTFPIAFILFTSLLMISIILHCYFFPWSITDLHNFTCVILLTSLLLNYPISLATTLVFVRFAVKLPILYAFV